MRAMILSALMGAVAGAANGTWIGLAADSPIVGAAFSFILAIIFGIIFFILLEHRP